MILGYWNIKARAEPIRYLLAYLKVDYKEVNPEARDWFTNRTKYGFDFPNLPYIIDGDFKLTESKAIMEYILYK